MTLHLAAAAENVSWRETMASDVPWRGEVVRETVRRSAGKMSIPAAPGLGVELDEAACARHPYVARDLRHYQGTLTDIRPPDAQPFYASAEAGGQA